MFKISGASLVIPYLESQSIYHEHNSLFLADPGWIVLGHRAHKRAIPISNRQSIPDFSSVDWPFDRANTVHFVDDLGWTWWRLGRIHFRKEKGRHHAFCSPGCKSCFSPDSTIESVCQSPKEQGFPNFPDALWGDDSPSFGSA